MNFEELQEKMNALVSTAETENRSLTDEEITEYEGLEGQLAQARKTEEINKRNKAYSAPNIIRTPGTIAKGDEVLERAFDNYLRTGQKNADLIENRAMGTDSPTAGGYLVPDGFRNKLMDRLDDLGGLASAAEVINTDSGNPISWPVAEDDRNNLAEIKAEHAQFGGGADLAIGTRSLGAYKYTTTGANDDPLRVSVELLQDAAFDVQAFISRKFASRIRRAQNADYATGDGTDEPLGLFTTTADVTSNTLDYGTLLDMVHTVDPEYRENGKWVFNDASLKALRNQVDGNGRPILADASTGLAASLPGQTLLGYAVVLDNAANAVASGVNYAAFGDIREGYIVRNVKDVTVVVNPYSRANYGEVEFVAWARSDGTIQNRDAYAVAKGE